MKKNIVLMALTIIALAGVIGAMGYWSTQRLTAYQAQELVNQAVDGCMQSSHYTWQQPNPKNPQLTDTNTEPNRFWYKVCMNEKGYSISSELQQ